MTDPDNPKPSEEERLKALDTQLKAIEGRQLKEKKDWSSEKGSHAGMQILGELLGGILGGLGLGYLFDQATGSKPWGMISGTLIGMVSAIYLILKKNAN
jgi:ATP synthase protein I